MVSILKLIPTIIKTTQGYKSKSGAHLRPLQKDVVSFCNTVKVEKGLLPEQLESYTREILGKCKYGLNVNELIKSKDFYVDYGDKAVMLNNICDGKPGKFQGLCHHLAYKVGKEIEKKFGDTLKVFVIKGDFPQFSTHENPFSHYFIGCFPKNDATLLDEYKKLYKSHDFDAKHVSKLPNKFILIDPSFKTLGNGTSDLFKEHNFRFFQELSEVNPFKKCFEKLKFNQYTDISEELPLGKVNEMAANVLHSSQDDDLVLMRFIKNDDGDHEIRLSTLSTIGDEVEITDIIKAASSKVPLNALVRKIETEKII